MDANYVSMYASKSRRKIPHHQNNNRWNAIMQSNTIIQLNHIVKQWQITNQSYYRLQSAVIFIIHFARAIEIHRHSLESYIVL